MASTPGLSCCSAAQPLKKAIDSVPGSPVSVDSSETVTSTKKPRRDRMVRRVAVTTRAMTVTCSPRGNWGQFPAFDVAAGKVVECLSCGGDGQMFGQQVCGFFTQ